MQRQETPTPALTATAGRRFAVLTVIVTVLVLAFYYWTASSTDDPFIFSTPKNDYYNLLTDGFLSGHLYMAVKPDPALFSADPAVRAGAHTLLDASLYHRHYYLYFGVVPLLLVFLPWKLLTGHGIPPNFAALLFATAGFLLALALLARIRRRHFARAGPLLWSVVIVATGFCTLAPEALRHAMFYEVAITSAFAFAMLFFYAAERALSEPEHAGRWLALAGSACALAIGSRANLAFSVLLLPPLAWMAWRRIPEADGRRPSLVRLGTAAGAPAAAGLALLALYNVLRFGNPFEFGHSFQVGSNPNGFPFALPFLWHNLRIYFFSLPCISRYFPFFTPGLEGARPAGYWGIEHVHAQFFSVRFVVLAGAAAVAARRRSGLGGLLGLLGGWFVSNGLVVCLTGVRADRYLVDFQPALVLGAAVGALALAGRTGWGARAARGGTIALLLFGSFYNAMASVQLHEFFRIANEMAYQRLARVFDYPAWWWERIAGDPTGPLELQIVFPRSHRQDVEPLVATGTPWFSDTIYVHYFTPDRVNFGFDHTQYRNDAGPPVDIVPGKSYRLDVTMGSLYPPSASPRYEGLTLAQIRELKRTVRVRLDGKVVYETTSACYDAAPGQVHLGTNPLWPSAESGHFSGTLRLIARPPVDLAPLRRKARTETGPIGFRVQFPTGQEGFVDPLVVTGVTGRADILFVRYLDGGHVRFGLDHWNGPQLLSPIVPVDYGRPHELGVYMGSLYPPSDRVPEYLRHLLMVSLDGRMVWATRAVFHRADPLTVDVGRNAIGASTCRLYFRGNIFDVHRLKPPGPPAPATGAQAPQLLSICLPDVAGEPPETLFKTVDRAGQPLVGLIRYRDRRSVELGLTIGPRTVWSAPLPADYEQIHTVLVGLPAPTADESGGGFSAYLRQEWQAGVHLYFNRRLAVEESTAQPAPDAAAWRWPDDILAGKHGADQAIAGLLSRVDADQPFVPPPSDWSERGGHVHLELRLPPGRTGISEPLLATGRTGEGDSLYVHYVDDRHISFGLDHWGFSASTSPEAAVDYRKPVSLDVDWDRAHNRLVVVVNGREVWRRALHFFPGAGVVDVGVNLIGFSTSNRYFTGDIVAARFEVAGSPP